MRNRMTKGEKGTSQMRSLSSVQRDTYQGKDSLRSLKENLHEPFKENVQIYSRETF